MYMKRRKGDTLIEVAFAIGIFSLVAITVVAVISASTSAAQASLETTRSSKPTLRVVRTVSNASDMMRASSPRAS